MWLKIKNTEMYLNFTDKHNFKLFLTDYISIWFAYFSKPQFIECLKESNKKFSKMLESVMLQNATQILINPEDVSAADITKADSFVKLKLTKKFAYDFKIILNFTEGSKELFFREVTCPLLNIVQQLNKSQAKLCAELKKKDIEINAYKNLDPSVTIPFHEKTTKFNANTYLSKHSLYQDMFGLVELPSSLLEKKVSVSDDTFHLPNGTEVKCEIKMEAESQSEDTISSNHNETNNIAEIDNNMKKEPVLNVKPEFVKSEPGSSLPSPRKKIRKLNL